MKMGNMNDTDIETIKIVIRETPEKILDMFPNLSFVDAANTRCAYIILFGQNSTHNSIFSRKSNLLNNLIGQLRCLAFLSKTNKSGFQSMSSIFLRRTPLKVFNPIVRFYSIFMVYLWKIEGVINVRLRNKSVREWLPNRTFYIKPKLEVSASFSRFYKFSCGITTTPTSFFTPYSPIFRNKISFISSMDSFHLSILT